MIIKKWQTMLGQTLYTKDFKLNDTRQQSSQPGVEMQIPQQPSLYDWVELSNLKAEQQAQSKMQTKISAQEPRQEIPTPQKVKRQFILDSNDVAALLGNPQFKNNITVGKVMKIIQALIDSEKASDVLANQFEVEQVMVDLIKGFVKR